MEHGWIIAGAILAFLGLISQARLSLHVSYRRRPDAHVAYVDLYLFRCWRLYRKTVKRGQSDGGSASFAAAKPSGGVETAADAYRSAQDFYRLFSGGRRKFKSYRPFVNALAAKLDCTRLYWRTVIGAEDAAAAALLYGALCAVKGGLLAWLRRKVAKVEEPVVSVAPVFNADRLETDFQCIFSIKLGNVIYAARNLL